MDFNTSVKFPPLVILLYLYDLRESKLILTLFNPLLFNSYAISLRPIPFVVIDISSILHS